MSSTDESFDNLLNDVPLLHLTESYNWCELVLVLFLDHNKSGANHTPVICLSDVLSPVHVTTLKCSLGSEIAGVGRLPVLNALNHDGGVYANSHHAFESYVHSALFHANVESCPKFTIAKSVALCNEIHGNKVFPDKVE